MNILVLAGSPKGEISVTMQYVLWLQKHFPQHEWNIVQIASNISRIEKDDALFESIRLAARAADGVIWAFPLYYCMVQGGYKRFIELAFERGMADDFRGKHAAILSTSIHFYDSTAMEYMRGICEDLGMTVGELFAPHMTDLLEPQGPQQLRLFMEKWVASIETGASLGRLTAPIFPTSPPFELPLADAALPKRKMKVGIVTQSGVSQNLDNMVAHFAAQFEAVELYDLSTMHIAGNCLGCMKCGHNYECAYEGKDDVIDTYRKLKACDAVVYAGFIQDRYLSARWKTFMDRWFFSTHTPFFAGKPMGMLIAGPLRQLHNLRTIFEGFFSTMEVRLAGIATDEGEDVAQSIGALADSLQFYTTQPYAPPVQFYGVAGRLIFRDEIYTRLGGVFGADYAYYKKHGWFNLPHKQRKTRVLSAIMRQAMKLRFVRKNIHAEMKNHMVSAYQKVGD